MSSETAAAFAALVVAILAMAVTLAQAIQQYFVTGQLIRMCDSVVYGKMPGQGHRVWELSQFRFRILYSIPQIYLNPSLWSGIFPNHQSYAKDHLHVPDLRNSTTEEVHGSGEISQSHMLRQKRSAYSAVPGEAPWVSFCRTAQHASGNDLLYELVDGDADRCPGDLSVVPMQVSMRDIVTIALMAGMRCADASLETKSLSMEGPAGTITSSWHPILGAIIRFTARNFKEPQGLRINAGTVSPQWMARMVDAVVVAGRSYNRQERKYNEQWITSSNDQALTRAVPARSSTEPSSISMNFRRRNVASGKSVESSGNTSGSTKSRFTSVEGKDSFNVFNVFESKPSIHSSQHDGDETSRFWDAPVLSGRTVTDAAQVEGQPANTQQHPKWYVRLNNKVRRYYKDWRSAVWDADVKQHDVDVEGGGLSEKTTKISGSVPHEPSQMRSEAGRGNTQAGKDLDLQYQAGSHRAIGTNPNKLLDGEPLQQYIARRKTRPLRELKREKTQPIGQPQGEMRYLTWKTDEGSTQDERVEPGDENTRIEDWQKSYLDLEQERSRYYVERWKELVQRRSDRREERNTEELGKFSRPKTPSHWSSATQKIISENRARRKDRSISRGSPRSKKSFDIANKHASSEARGRSRTRNPRVPRQASSNLKDAEVSRERYRQKTFITSRENLSTSYPDLTKSLAEAVAEERMPKERKRPAVGFRFSDDQEPISAPLRGNVIVPDRVASDPLADSGVLVDPNGSSRRPEDVALSDNIHAVGPIPEESRSKHMADENRVREASVEKDPTAADSSADTFDPPKGILKAPTDQFPEEIAPVREDVIPFLEKQFQIGLEGPKSKA